MSATILADPAEAHAAHSLLVRDFTERYLDGLKSPADSLTHSLPFDPRSELCDYEKTWWSARPRPWSPEVAKFVLSLLIGVSGDNIENTFYEDFKRKAGLLRDELENRSTMLLTGHEPDVLAAVPLVSAANAIAEYDATTKNRSFRRCFADMVKICHVEATRALAPVMIGKAPAAVSLVRIARWGLSPHFVLPKNEAMNESDISGEFIKTYNHLAKDNMDAVTKGPSRHPDGLNVLWSMAPAGTRDKRINLENGQTALVIPEVTEGTINLIKRLGCTIVPVCTSLGDRKNPSVYVRRMIYPSHIGPETIHKVMVQMAEFRREHGEGEVYYAREAAAAPLLELYEQQKQERLRNKVAAIASRPRFLR